MKVQTLNFGELEVTESSIYFFSEGIPGFERAQTYALLELEEYSPFAHLQSTDNPDLVFILVNPFEFFPSYEFDLSDVIIDELKIKKEEDEIIIRSIVNNREGLVESTTNLIAPIVLNAKQRVGKQIILTQGEYTTKHRLFTQSVSE
jgi:flagellar assembly factor FliW